MKPLVLHSEAIAELDGAVAYYQDQRSGLGLDFLFTVERAFSKIQQHPELGTPYKIRGLRRFVLQQFPFLIFYAELEACTWIVAIAHSKRKPDYWRKRQIE
ncbi:type II toxin-antitoxin system RelE/ParE family toxin [Nodosilinea sp. LEGE 06152]|uniref:type II toxin-antitoxin system RelE/ParE family toxin n=1 Tax=Nodosilinea sp. LEGE 06152 TaxID=2777966 RepID=UPI001880E2B3|nr:type II toxin-antitoxin system RelE/ParE family toxin [Nodosilinea sp. LEGE 06152]